MSKKRDKANDIILARHYAHILQLQEGIIVNDKLHKKQNEEIKSISNFQLLLSNKLVEIQEEIRTIKKKLEFFDLSRSNHDRSIRDIFIELKKLNERVDGVVTEMKMRQETMKFYKRYNVYLPYMHKFKIVANNKEDAIKEAIKFSKTKGCDGVSSEIIKDYISVEEEED